LNPELFLWSCIGIYKSNKSVESKKDLVIIMKYLKKTHCKSRWESSFIWALKTLLPRFSSTSIKLMLFAEDPPGK